MVKDRYYAILNISNQLIKNIEIPSNYFLTDFNYDKNILYKIAGYNCNLDGALRHIELNSIKAKIFFIPFIGKQILELLYNKKFKYEVSLDKSELLKHFKTNKKYEHIFFATSDTYVKAFFPVIENIDKEKVLAILPYKAINWSNFKKLLDYNIDIVFIESFLPQTFFNEVMYVSQKIETSYVKNFNKLLTTEYKYIYVRYKYIFLDFLKNLFSFQVVFNFYLNSFLEKVVLSKKTNCYIARDRTAIQNSFVQIANLKRCITNIIIHGLMSKNIETNLWINGSFSNADNVYVWGKHDKDVILKTQKLINEKIPNIIVGKYLPFEIVENKRKNYILFIMQNEINFYIKKIWHYSTLKKEKIVVRLHPSDKHLIGKYKKLENEYFSLDKLDNSLAKSLESAKLVVGYYSTGLLESMYNKIPVVFLQLKDIDRSILIKETSLSETEKKIVILDNIFCLDEKKRQLEEIIKVNKKIKRDFMCD